MIKNEFWKYYNVYFLSKFWSLLWDGSFKLWTSILLKIQHLKIVFLVDGITHCLMNIVKQVSIKGCCWLLRPLSPSFLSLTPTASSVSIHLVRNVVGRSINCQDILVSILPLCPVKYVHMNKDMIFHSLGS